MVIAKLHKFVKLEVIEYFTISYSFGIYKVNTKQVSIFILLLTANLNTNFNFKTIGIHYFDPFLSLDKFMVKVTLHNIQAHHIFTTIIIEAKLFPPCHCYRKVHRHFHMSN